MNHRHQLSTTAAADGLQLGSGLRRIVCLAALLFIFVAGVRAQYPITETAFPDKNFYKVVLDKYSMSNGANFLTNPGVTSMDVKSLTIRDLTGIGLFPLLQTLDCSNNQLRSADLQYNVYLTTVTIYKNRLYGTGMDKFIENLFDRSQQPTKGELRIIFNEDASTGNKMTSAQVEAAKKRGWTPKMSTNGTTWTDYPGSDAIAINATNFPDQRFREWLLEQSYGVDGYLSTSEIAAVTKIDVLWRSISSLKGIEYFTALKELNCYNNQLKSLDVSKNTELTYLDCSDNQLTTLDVSGCTALTYLYCWGNQLTTLDVSKNTALTELDCRNNQLTSLDVSNNTALKELRCGSNQLTSLDVSSCTGLKWLYCNENQLTTLDVSGCTALGHLECYINQLTFLNVSGCTALRYLDCSKNLIRGEAMTNLVTSLPDRETASEEGSLRVYRDETPAGNMMTKVQVKIATDKNWNVQMWDEEEYDWVPYEGETPDGIEISEANFPDDNFRAYVSSEDIDRNRDGYLSDEEISGVTTITVSYHEISDLKGIEFFTALTELNCSYNQLTSLDVSSNTALTRLYCYSNLIRGVGMTTLVTSLPDRNSPSAEEGTLWVYYDEPPEGNMMTTKQVKIASEKNWNVVMWDDDYEEFIPYEGETLDGIEISEANFPDDNFRAYVSSENIDRDENGYLSDEEIVATREINVSEMEIESLKGIEYFKKLEELSCFINQLTSLDVSDCSALRFLNCFGNQLTSLDLSKNTALTYLDCGFNQLTSLDLSKNTALTSLICFNNQLSSLDMSHNTGLERLECYSNQIRGAAMTTLVNSLPDRKSASEEGTLLVYYDYEDTPEGNMMTKVQVGIATDKNWNVWMYDDEEVYDWVAYEGEIIPGDANGNGVVDAQDIDCLRNYILGLDPQPFSLESADLDGDSAVDIQDLTLLIQLLTE